MHPVGGTGLDHPPALLHIQGHRFLAQDLLAGLGRGHRLRAVQVRGAGNVDGVHLGILEQSLQVAVGPARSMSGRELLCPGLAVAVKSDEVAVRLVVDGRGHPLVGDVPAAENSPLDSHTGSPRRGVAGSIA